MKLSQKSPPREYQAGHEIKRTIKDCGDVFLSNDEQITFKTDDGTEYDVTKKDFGYYATPSLNGRLPRFNLRPALLKNRNDQFFVLLVEVGKMLEFEKYILEEQMLLVTWLDETAQLKKIENAVR